MDYLLNVKNKIRYRNNVATGLYYLLVKSNKLIVMEENEAIVWQKTFDNNIISISKELGNFGNISELINITLDNDICLKYATSGTLIYKSRDDIYFDNYYEECRANILYSIDTKPGLYRVKCQVDKKMMGQFELFDTRGMCIYEGENVEVECKVLVSEYEILQIKSRDNISIKNIEIEKISDQRKIVVIGDSTLTNQELPFWGWPQLLQARTNIPTLNFAISARSTKSFREEGRLDYVKSCIVEGDILLIGFGHNDEKLNYFGTIPEEYITNIKNITKEYKTLGAKVIVTTPIARRTYSNGKLVESHGEYIKKLRSEISEDIIDMNLQMKLLINQLGEIKSKELFVHNDLLKIYDDTHTSYIGASNLCDFAADELKNIISGDR